ncbi:unnamed protein product [Agarophyton chilense]
MGFKWSVHIAHTLAASLLQEAFHLFKQSRFSPSPRAQLFPLTHNSRPCHLERSCAELLHIIDEISVVVASCDDDPVLALQRIVRNTFIAAKLPIHDSKSSDISQVVKDSIPFIGCIWNLAEDVVRPELAKTAKLATQAEELLQSYSIHFHEWESLLGRTIWPTLLNRRLLSIMNAVFRVPMPSKRDDIITIHPSVRKEIEMLHILAPLRAAPLNLPTSRILITFDASFIGGAVMFATIERWKSLCLWEKYQNNCTLHRNESSSPPKLDELSRKI